MITISPLSQARCTMQPGPFHLSAGSAFAACPAAMPTHDAPVVSAFDAAQFETVARAEPLPWTRIRASDFAAFVASRTPSGRVLASAGLRGTSPAEGPAPPTTQALALRANAIRKLLRDFALEDPPAGAPDACPAAVRSGLRSQSIDILLATRAEFACLLRESGVDPASATGRIALLQTPPRILVDAQRFFQDAADPAAPSPSAKDDLLKLFVQPRWRELLQPAKRLLALPRRTLEDALHTYVQNRSATSRHARLDQLLEALLQGDAIGVMRAVIPDGYRIAAGRYAVLPSRTAPLFAGASALPRPPTADELSDVVAEALAHTQPRTAAARQLKQLLGPRSQEILEAAVARQEPEALRRVGYAQALMYTHALVGNVLRELSGTADLPEIDVDLRFPGGAARYERHALPDAAKWVLQVTGSASKETGVLASDHGTVLFTSAKPASVATDDRATLLQNTMGALAGRAIDESVARVAASLPEARYEVVAAPWNSLFQYLAGRLSPADRTAGNLADDLYTHRVILGRSMRTQLSPDEVLRRLVQVVFNAYPTGHPDAGRRDDELDRFARDMIVQFSIEHRPPGGSPGKGADDTGKVVGYHTALLAGNSANLIFIVGEQGGRLLFKPLGEFDAAMLRLAGARRGKDGQWTVDPKYVATVGIPLDASASAKPATASASPRAPADARRPAAAAAPAR